MPGGDGAVTVDQLALPEVVVIEGDPHRRHCLARALGPGISAFGSVEEARAHLGPSAGRKPVGGSPVVVVSGPSLDPVTAMSLVPIRPGSTVVAVHGRATTAELRSAMAAGVGDLVGCDAPVSQLRHSVRRAGVAVQFGGGPPHRGESGAGDPGPAASTIAVGGEVQVGSTVGGEVRPEGGVVAVLSPKGGSGGTTVAANLALALAAGAPATVDGPPVAVLVDADLQFGDAALVCGVDPARSLVSLVRGPQGAAGPPPDGRSVGRALVRLPGTAVALLAAPVDPALAETLPAGLIGEVLDALAGVVAWVVVDLPSSLDDRALETLDRAGTVLVVATPDPLGMKDARAVVDLLERLGLGARWSAVCNAPTGLPGPGVGALEQHLGRRVVASVPHDPAVAAAVLRGRPLLADAPSAPAARAIATLAATLRTPPPGGRAPASAMRQLVDRIVGGTWRIGGTGV